MGCWNGTCYLSNLPIVAGQRVVGYVLASKKIKSANALCYSTDWAFPISFAFRGKYDDYGGVMEIEDDLATKIFYQHMGLKDLGEFEQWVNTQVERDQAKPLDLDKKSRESYEKLMREQPEKYSTEESHVPQMIQYFSDSYNLSLYMAHAPIFDRMVSDKKARQEVELDLEEIINNINHFFDKEELSSLRNMSSLMLFGLNARREEGSNRKGWNKVTSLFTENVGPSGCLDPFKEFILNKFIDGDGDSVRDLLPAIQDRVLYSEILEWLRKSWGGVPSGKGSQSYGYKYYLELTKAMNEIAKKGKKEQGGDW